MNSCRISEAPEDVLERSAGKAHECVGRPARVRLPAAVALRAPAEGCGPRATAEWRVGRGVPPEGGRPITMTLAVGTFEGYLLDHVAYVDLSTYPGIDRVYPISPWGRAANRVQLECWPEL